MGRIILENIEFYAYHGCFTEEQIVGSKFLVTVKFDYNSMEAEKTDSLSKTINYQEVYVLIKKEMEQKSRLLEHVASRIADAIKNNFHEAEKISVKVTKINPPLGAR
jgi:dihydroneopterin aldolase